MSEASADATLLTDEQYLSFLHDGYVVIEPTALGKDYHQRLWQQADALYETARVLESTTAHLEILGDNLRAAIPEVDRLLEDPAVVGAVRSVLGTGAFLHPHHYVHRSMSKDQPFHQDGNLPWNERGHYRSHRPDWLILFYYPQDVVAANGPTEIVTGSQYWTTDIERADGTWRPGDPVNIDINADVLADTDLAARDAVLAASLDQLEIPGLERRCLEVPAGSVVLASYDLMHRGTRTTPTEAARYMYKFYFARTTEPDGAAWMNSASNPPVDVRAELAPIIESNWAWARGQRRRVDLGDQEVAVAVNDVMAGGEHLKVAAAYRLGMDTGTASLNALLEALHSDQEATRRASAYGLRLRCDEVGTELATACTDDRVSVRRFAIFALGAIWSPGADSLLDRLVHEPDDLARSNAAYALGQLARDPSADAARIAPALLSRLEPGVEPDNTDIAGLSRSTVRQSVAHALLQLAANHALDDNLRSGISELISSETDRYVAGMLVEAIALHSADAGVIRTLAARRWNTLPPD